MNYEPLKGKILLWNQVTGDILTIDGKYFLETKTENGKFIEIILKSDIKSAVQGLLQEIEELTDWYPDYQDTLMSVSDVKKLIKKWFADVVEE